jgi:hypothetical protein
MRTSWLVVVILLPLLSSGCGRLTKTIGATSPRVVPGRSDRPQGGAPMPDDSEWTEIRVPGLSDVLAGMCPERQGHHRGRDLIRRHDQTGPVHCRPDHLEGRRPDVHITGTIHPLMPELRAMAPEAATGAKKKRGRAP